MDRFDERENTHGGGVRGEVVLESGEMRFGRWSWELKYTYIYTYMCVHMIVKTQIFYH